MEACLSKKLEGGRGLDKLGKVGNLYSRMPRHWDLITAFPPPLREGPDQTSDLIPTLAHVVGLAMSVNSPRSALLGRFAVAKADNPVISWCLAGNQNCRG